MNTGLVSKWIIFILFLLILPFSIPAGGRQETLRQNDTVIREAELSVPVSDVVLFSTGVGYFQREGWVEGSGSLDLYFNQADVNDLLKSMVLQDTGGGTITSVNYASREPLAQTLKNLSIDIISNPGLHIFKTGVKLLM